MEDTQAVETTGSQSDDSTKDSYQAMTERIKREVEDTQRSRELVNLSAYIRKCWDAAKSAKEPVQRQLYESAMQRKGEYTQEKLGKLGEQSSAAIFMNVTAEKCRAAESWFRDVISGERVWDISPTPIPDLTPELEAYINATVMNKTATSSVSMTMDDQQEMQEYIKDNVEQEVRKTAYDATERMKRKIDDQLSESDWRGAIDSIIPDIVTYKAGFLKGPIVQNENRLRWTQDDNGQWIASQEKTLTIRYVRVSAFDIYPSPTSTSVDDGFLIERMFFTRKNLTSMVGVLGYDDASIIAALDMYSENGLYSWAWTEDEKRSIEERGVSVTDFTKSPDKLIEALEFWGSVKGSLLIEWGMQESGEIRPDEEYDINAILIGDYVIKAIINPNPTGKKPYYKASYEEIPGAFWGRGVPELMRDIQDMCNACARALVMNMSIASGPQGIVDMGRLRAGTSIDSIYPWKIWLYDSTESYAAGSAKAIDFFMPDSNANELMAVFNTFEEKAERATGIPAYTYGNSKVGGAGRALADYENVITPSGRVDIGSMKVGDRVCNTYGSESKVTGVYPQGISDIFRVKLSNGDSVDCDMNHIWNVRTHNDREFRQLTTKEIVEKGVLRKTKISKKNPKGYRAIWMLPMHNGVEFDKQEVKIDPYTMGALLGDGDSRCRLTSCDSEIFDRIPYDLGKPEYPKDNRAITRSIKGIKKDYHGYGLKCKSIHKFIPKEYLYNTREVRLELLRGLVDTDGCVMNDGRAFISSSSYALIEDFRFLVKSLGGETFSVITYDGGEFDIKGRRATRQGNHRLGFRLQDEVISCLNRKQSRVRRIRKKHLYIIGVESVGRHNATCITVDSKDSLFLCGNFVPTHNTATGLSMLMTNASKGIKSVLATIDKNIIRPSITELYIFNMMFSDDQSIKGDLNVVALGVASLIEKEQTQIRQIEFMNMLSANPIYTDIIGYKGIAKLLRRAVVSMNLGDEGIVPDDKEIEAKEMEAQRAKEMAMQAEMGMVGGGDAGGSGGGGRSPLPNPTNVMPDGSPVGGLDAAMFTARRNPPRQS